MSGGGAVYHDRDREFVYSITVPEGMFPKDVVGAYKAIMDRMVRGLAIAGVEAWVKDDSNVMVGKRKVSGNSQRRSRGVLQVHGTVLYDADEETMFSVLRARPGEPVESRATPSKHHPVTGLRPFSDMDCEGAYRMIKRSLLDGDPCAATSWTEEELSRAEELVTEKYGVDSWNLFL
jgi:lipoate-protein ligase A